MKFHTSGAAGLKSGQFNQKKNYIFEINDEVSYKLPLKFFDAYKY